MLVLGNRKYSDSIPFLLSPLRACRFCGLQIYSENKLALFRRNNHSKFGYENTCKKCYNKRNRFAERVYHKRYYERHTERYRAWVLVSRKVPLGSNCSVCGNIEDLCRHHPDYSKPSEIITVCRNCHLSIHSKGK